MPTTIDLESQRMLLGSTPVRKIYQGQNLLGTRIAELFANGEQGVWYDPSDLSTMFQDSAGATPVTAVEQPVGLILDKSKGLVLGPELVVNGAFDTDTAWTKVRGAVISEGAANIPATGYIYQVKNLQQGKFYLVTATISNYVVGSGQHVQYRYDYGGATTRTIFSIDRNGSFSGVLNINYAPSGQGVFVESQSGSFTIDSISVRELPGNHASQPTATSRPVLRQDGNGKHYLYFDGVDDGMSTGSIVWTSAATCFTAIRHTSNIWADVWLTKNSGSGFWAVGQSGSSATPTGDGVGPAKTYVDGLQLTPDTRGQVALEGFNRHRIFETRALNLTPASGGLTVGSYSSFMTKGDLFGLIIAQGVTEQESTSVRKYLTSKMGGVG